MTLSLVPTLGLRAYGNNEAMVPGTYKTLKRALGTPDPDQLNLCQMVPSSGTLETRRGKLRGLSHRPRQKGFQLVGQSFSRMHTRDSKKPMGSWPKDATTRNREDWNAESLRYQGALQGQQVLHILSKRNYAGTEWSTREMPTCQRDPNGTRTTEQCVVSLNIPINKVIGFRPLYFWSGCQLPCAEDYSLGLSQQPQYAKYLLFHGHLPWKSDIVACEGLLYDYLSGHRRQSWGLGCHKSQPPDIWVGVVVFPWNIIIYCNVQEYEMRALSKVVTLQK